VVGPLVPVWLGDGADELFFFRSVQIGPSEILQGFYCDWPRLRSALLALVEDLVPAPRLTAIRGDRSPSCASALWLASIPAPPDAAPARTAPAGWPSPVHATLATAWLAVIAALAAAGVTLRASIEFGERRSRFASAVTHELRTPLTTFRMYSEMLSEGMVS